MSRAGGRGGQAGASSAAATAGRAANPSDVLHTYILREYNVPLDNIYPAENSRQINPAGVQRLMESITKGGFMPTCPPQVMFSDVGEDEEVTEERAGKLRAIVLDGSHRCVQHNR